MIDRTLGYVIVSLVLVLTACESGAALGTPCTRASECSSPLVCRLGNCRTECAAARDCGPGQVCLLNAASEGACEIPAIDTCSLSCEAPLICASGRCRVECTVDGDCPEGHGCVANACQRSDSTPDAGGGDDAAVEAAVPNDAGLFCDPVHDSGCPGERCGLVGAAPACVANGGSSGLGADCSDESDCQAGLSCQGARCVQVCFVGDDASCGNDLVCSRDSVAGQTFIPFESPIGLCSETCVPLTDVGCPSSATCSIGVGTDRDFTWCRVRGDRGEGATCEYDGRCLPGLRCHLGACRNICTWPDGPQCGAGFSCDVMTAFEGPDQYGVCLPD